MRYVGEREVPERMSTEHLRTEERVVEETVTSPCSPLECNGCVPTGRGVAGNGVSIQPFSPLAVACQFQLLGFELVGLLSYPARLAWIISVLTALTTYKDIYFC